MNRSSSTTTIAAAGLILAACLLGSVSAYDNGAPHSRLPPLGWSSWVALGPGDAHPIFDFCDAASVVAAIDAYVSDDLGLYAAGYRHFHLDDCWAGGRNSSGYLYAEKDHFPNGMAPVVAHAHAKGVVFGLYTCAGTKTCVGGRPGSKDHWAQDAAVFAEWGVDWVKMDWCNTQGMNPETTYPKMSKAMNGTGRAMHLNMCEWGKDDPWKWGDAIAQSWRATGDHTPVWSSTKQIIAASAAIPARYSGRPYGWNDLDMLETGNYAQAAHANGREGNMSATEYKTEFSMWAISASPLVVTTPIMKCAKAPGNVDGSGNATGVACTPTVTALQREILLNAEMLAVNQDVTPQGRPLDDGDLTVWARALSDGSVAIAYYNQDDKAATIGPVPFAKLGWAAGAKAEVRDLWKHATSHAAGALPAATVAPHEALVYRVTKA